jgi:site-specific recombinase XerC
MPTEVLGLLAATGKTREPARDLAIVAVLIDAGPARGEIACLVRRDYDPKRGLISIGAGDDVREIRLGQSSAAALDGLLTMRDLPLSPLLCSKNGTPVTDRTVQELLRRLSQAADLQVTVTCRDTRRTWMRCALGVLPGSVVARPANHHPARMRRATSEEALAALFDIGWVSPLDRLVAESDTLVSRRAA